MFFIVILFFLGGLGNDLVWPGDHRPRQSGCQPLLSSHCSHRMGGKVSFKYGEKRASLIGVQFFCPRFSILLMIPHGAPRFVQSLGSKHFPAAPPWQAFDSEEPIWERKSSGAELGSTWIGRWDRPLGIQELKIPHCGWAMGSTHNG